MSTWPTEVGLLRDLVAIPSISGQEAAVAEFVEATARRSGLDVVCDETSVRVVVDSGLAGPALALASHLDVVPPGDGWTRDPFTPTIENGLLYGRGSGDAKASVAAMLSALGDLAGKITRGRVVGLFSFGEETRDATMPLALPRAGSLDAAIIGEPTNLRAAIAQRGLMMVDLVARGTQRHAGHVGSADFVNAITVLASDLQRLDAIVADRPHPMLGLATITPTMLDAGISRNVTSPVARAVIDVRSTPEWTHEELAAAIRKDLDCEVVITSDRLVPCETPPGSKLLASIKRVLPEVECYGSPTCSDWCHLRHLDAVKLGPGTSLRSHTADEAVDLDEVVAARHTYARIALEFLS